MVCVCKFYAVKMQIFILMFFRNNKQLFFLSVYSMFKKFGTVQLLLENTFFHANRGPLPMLQASVSKQASESVDGTYNFLRSYP